MNMQLSELERKAYREGDTEKAEIIAQLIQAREVLEKLTEQADSFATIIEREAKAQPSGIADGFALIDTDSDYFTDLVNAISDAQEAIND